IEKVKMPVVAPIAIGQGGGTMKAKTGGADLLQAPENNSRVFGRLAAGTAATVLGTAGSFVKVSLGDNRFAFVKVAELEQGGAPAAAGRQRRDGHRAREPGYDDAPHLRRAKRRRERRAFGHAEDRRRPQRGRFPRRRLTGTTDRSRSGPAHAILRP